MPLHLSSVQSLPQEPPSSTPPRPPTTQIPNQGLLTGDCEGVRGAMPQFSWVLGEPGGLGTGDLSGLEPVEEKDQVTLKRSGKQDLASHKGSICSL